MAAWSAYKSNGLQPSQRKKLCFPIEGSFCLEGWKRGSIENDEGIEKWEDRKDLVFFHMRLVERMEKLRDGKLICLVENKKMSGWKMKLI